MCVFKHSGLTINEGDVMAFVGGTTAAVDVVSHGYDFEREFYFLELEEPVEEDGTRVVI